VILITDVLLESTTSQQATVLGLEKKPGFGLYGPPNGPATHRSLFGRLTKLKGKKNKQPAPVGRLSTLKGKKNKQPADGEDWPVFHVPDVDVDPTKTQNERQPVVTISSTRAMVIADTVRKTLSSSGTVDNIDATLNAITAFYGRETAPKIVPPGEGFRVCREKYGIDPAGVYNMTTDAIEMAENQVIPSSPISEWTTEDVIYFSTHIHEALHSVSGRLRPGAKFYTSAINVAIEEGLTELLAESIINETLQNPSVTEPAHYAYRSEVTAMKIMADWGDLDIDATFRDAHSTRPLGADYNGWSIRTRVQDAQHTTIQRIMVRVGFTQDKFEEISRITRTLWDDDILALANSGFAATLMSLAEQKSDVDLEYAFEKLKSVELTFD
jgi:hypothetical protein